MDKAVDILAREMQSLKEDLIAKYNELGMRASGQWEQSLEVQVSQQDGGLKGVILGADYSQQLDAGRSQGKQPPSEAIEQWIRDKGIATRLERNMSISSLAFLIARKIAREGWKRENHGGVNLISQVVTPERIQSIIDKLSDIYIPEFTNDIITYLRTAA